MWKICVSSLSILVSFFLCYVLPVRNREVFALCCSIHIFVIQLNDVFEGRRFAVREAGAEAFKAVEAVCLAGHLAGVLSLPRDERTNASTAKGADRLSLGKRDRAFLMEDDQIGQATWTSTTVGSTRRRVQ